MCAVLNDGGEIKISAGMASQKSWFELDENFSVKVLSIDEAKHSVEALFKIKGGYRSGKHKHTCETHIYIVEGKVYNHAIGCTFGPGDYCFQADNDIHDEEFMEDTVAYVSYRGNSEQLVEFYDDDEKVCGHFSVKDFLPALNG